MNELERKIIDYLLTIRDFGSVEQLEHFVDMEDSVIYVDYNWDNRVFAANENLAGRFGIICTTTMNEYFFEWNDGQFLTEGTLRPMTNQVTSYIQDNRWVYPNTPLPEQLSPPLR